MKKKKLTLEELKVESFVTTMGLQQAHQVFGGQDSFAVSVSDAGCPTWGVGGGLTGNGNGGGNSINVPGGPCDPKQTTVRCNTTSDCGDFGNGGTGGGTGGTGGGTGGGGGVVGPDPSYTPDSSMCYTQNVCYG